MNDHSIDCPTDKSNFVATFDPTVITRYDKPGPRYTSYPTAPTFAEKFGAEQFVQVAQSSNDLPIPCDLSIYVHVPFCLSPCFYCGCNRVITRDHSRAEKYLEFLLREISMVAPLFDADREVVQLHLGGGTPNFLNASELTRLFDHLACNFNLSQASERDFSIELDPRCVCVTDIQVMAQLGLNRASLGVQDFDPDVQAAVNRIQSVEQTMSVIDACRHAGMRSINVDLIYGLPKQTAKGFARTLDAVLTAKPDRLAIYSYAHMPALFKAQKQIEAADLPCAQDKLALLQLAIERLSGAGYQYIGMDHFALVGDELSRAQRDGTLQRNFMGYTTHGATDLLGLGVSAISHVGTSYAQNFRDLPNWEAAIAAGRMPTWRGLELSTDDALRAELINRLMCQGEIDFATLDRRYDIRFEDYFATDLQRLAPLLQDQLAQQDGRQIRATSKGRLLLRLIAACFDRYLHDTNNAPARFSKAI
jgi:oxygen-independent coproporphyrinogen III oxidase